MRRVSRSASRGHRRIDELVQLALGLGRSECAQEDRFYQDRLKPLIRALLADGHEKSLIEALDRLHTQLPRAFEGLSDLIEAEAMGGETGLLIALPILAWSRYDIPARSLNPEQCHELCALLKDGVVAAGASLVLADFLFGPDQLPAGYCGAYSLTSHLRQRLAEAEPVLAVDAAAMPTSNRYLADPRYLLGLIRARPGDHALFRWHDAAASRDEIDQHWQQAAHRPLSDLLSNCAITLLSPDAYFPALRRTDEHGRPFTLQACAAQMQAQYDLTPDRIHAVIAPCYDNAVLVEYRIGLLRENHPEVLQGSVWGLLEGEDDLSDVATQIRDVLQQMGIKRIDVLSGRFPVADCEDCGAPLFPGADGELTHTQTVDAPLPVSKQLH